MTRLDLIKTMSAEELVYYVYSIMLPAGKMYNDSTGGLIQWLQETPSESQLNSEQNYLSMLVRR